MSFLFSSSDRKEVVNPRSFMSFPRPAAVTLHHRGQATTAFSHPIKLKAYMLQHHLTSPCLPSSHQKTSKERKRAHNLIAEPKRLGSALDGRREDIFTSLLFR